MEKEIDKAKVQNKKFIKIIEELEEEKANYNNIDIPNTNLAQLDSKFKNSDKFTIKTIIDYLKLDRFELVANLAKVTDWKNASQIIAYRDWALRTVETLLSKLEKFSNTPEIFVNRMTWEEKNIKKNKL